jgi:NAD(P)-dependent dehydrogenase (short-subunit alcohol dehydrogenase family)
MKTLDRVLFERLWEEDDLRGAVVSLASQASDYITGHILSIDGSLTTW